MRLACAAALLVVFVSAAPSAAQDHTQHMMATPQAGWVWTWDGAAFLHANLQERRFTDFRQVESQNWFMTHGQRARGAATVGVHAMFSLEPFTLRRLGSAQVFQTGETLDGAPLVDYQHPHDLFMALEGTYERKMSDQVRLFARVAPVGGATFGPVAFMHRASALGNPTAPLGHHLTDSTHISRSVVALGVTEGTTTFEISTFKGREPDQDRLDLDLGVPDSVAVRVGWRSGTWGGQASIARVRDGETAETGDAIKVTASADGATQIRGRMLSWALVYGQVTESDNETHGMVAEGAWTIAPGALAYARAELGEKNILTAGAAHGAGINHEHVYSRIGALTLGYDRDVLALRVGRLSLGGDLTVYAVPGELRESYGRPVSLHLGLRYRVTR